MLRPMRFCEFLKADSPQQVVKKAVEKMERGGAAVYKPVLEKVYRLTRFDREKSLSIR